MTQLDLQQRLAASEKLVEVLEVLNVQKDECIDDLQQQVNELAAENSLLKDAILTHQEGFSVCEACVEENRGHHDDFCLELNDTTATDAAINEWMAKGVEMFAMNLAHRVHRHQFSKYFEDEGLSFAAQLRTQGASNEQR